MSAPATRTDTRCHHIRIPGPTRSPGIPWFALHDGLAPAPTVPTLAKLVSSTRGGVVWVAHLRHLHAEAPSRGAVTIETLFAGVGSVGIAGLRHLLAPALPGLPVADAGVSFRTGKRIVRIAALIGNAVAAPTPRITFTDFVECTGRGIIGITTNGDIDANAPPGPTFTLLPLGTGVGHGGIAGHGLFLADATDIFVASTFPTIGAARRIGRIAFARVVFAPAGI